MHFMFVYPQRGAEGDMLDPGPVASVAQCAEAAGWHGLAFTDHPAPGRRWLENGGHQSLDPFVTLGHAAAVTQKLKLHTHLAVAPYRNPLVLAKSVATVDKLSHGRMILGLGVGYHKKEFKALGVDFDLRNTLMDETLEVLPMHWSGEAFSYRGATFDASDVVGLPRPVQSPIPIWIGGNSRKSLERVAHTGAGWIPLMGPKQMSNVVRTPVISSFDELRDKITLLDTLWGERPGRPDILVPLSAAYSPGTDFTAHRDQIAELREMGVTWVAVPGLGPSPSPQTLIEYLETIGRELIGT